MASETPVHDLLLPRVTDLINQAVARGIQRDVVVAVLINIITAPGFDTAEPDLKAESVPHPDYQRSADVVPVDGLPANVLPPSVARTKPTSSNRCVQTADKHGSPSTGLSSTGLSSISAVKMA